MFKNLAQKLSFRNACIALVGSVPLLAMATPADPFDAALADVTAAVGEYAAALVGVAAIAVVFMVAVKYVKKLSGAA